MLWNCSSLSLILQTGRMDIIIYTVQLGQQLGPFIAWWLLPTNTTAPHNTMKRFQHLSPLTTPHHYYHCFHHHSRHTAAVKDEEERKNAAQEKEVQKKKYNHSRKVFFETSSMVLESSFQSIFHMSILENSFRKTFL